MFKFFLKYIELDQYLGHDGLIYHDGLGHDRLTYFNSLGHDGLTINIFFPRR